MVVNVTKYTLFLTSQYDAILMFGIGLTKSFDTACIFFYTHSPYWLLWPAMCHCNTHKFISAPS